jgi:hypothetical protein
MALLIMNEAAQMAQEARTVGEAGRLTGQRLCEAAGMWTYLADVVLPRVAHATAGQPLGPRRPVELADDHLARAMAR